MTVLPDLTHLPPIVHQRGGDPSLLFVELIHVVEQAIADHPRSKQIQVGPSELGMPCPRRLAYKMAGTRPVNDRPGWRPTVGTAVHAWLEDVFRRNNRTWRETTGEDVTRWLVEMKVDVGQVGRRPVIGSCDIYDRVTATSNDWKIVGPTSLKRYRANGPGEQYRIQGHLYGRGWVQRGLPVDTVAITFLPSNGELSDALFWFEPYDEQVALDALQRADGIATLVAAGGALAPTLLPTADAYCNYCPFYMPAATDLLEACPGHRVTHIPPIALAG